ncbi:MAG: TonB-dependent receptor [Flavobacteriales bacterium]|nr:TonB-dependent receptor [Flavobacteriales bacterium]
MRQSVLTIVLLVLLLPISVFSQTLKGKITDNANGETLIGVNIFNQDNVGTSTDIDGNFSLQLKPGQQNITFKFIGYETLKKSFVFKEGETIEFNTKLAIESTTLDLVVITGSQYEKKLSEEMVSVDVVQPYLVENTASPDLKAAVGKVPGVTILDGQASIRGGGGYSYGVGSRVQLVVDDVPLLTGDLKDIQWSAIPMETAQQIEVVKGSSSVLYGSGAMNGVINVRTGWGTEKPETTFRIYQGIYGNPKVEEARWWDKTFSPVFTGVFFSHRQKVKNVDFVIGAHGSSDLTYLQRGHRQAFRLNFKTRVQSVKIQGLSYGLNGSGQYQQSGRFTLWANNTDGAYKPLDGTSSTDKYTFVNIDPWVQYTAGKIGIFSLKSRYYRVERRNDDWEDPSASNVMFFDVRYQNEFKYNFRVTAGVQYQYVWSFSSLYPEAGTIVTHNPSVYAQVEKKFIDKISLLVGIRNEWNEVVTLRKETSLPIVRVGANFEVAKKTNIRASFGQSFRFPSIGEKFIDASLGPIKVLPNSELKSEHGWSAELGLKQGFRLSNWNANFDFALFWMEFRDMVEYRFGIFDVGDPNGPILGFKPFNVSKARVAGVEFGLQGEGKLGSIPVRAYLGYTFNYPADLQTDTTQQNVEVYLQNFFSSIRHSDSLTATSSILKYRITNVFKADVEMDLWKFTVGYTVAYNSYMNRIDSEFETFLPGFTEYRALNKKGVWAMDARLLFRISKRSTAGFIVKNFLNEFYSLRPGIMEAPRSFTLQYTLKIG